MTPTPFGFFGPNGQDVTVNARRDLGLPYVQDALRAAAAKPGTWLTCKCGGGQILPFRVSGFPSQVFDVRRASVADPHAQGCFASEQGFFLKRPPVAYASGAFAPPTTRVAAHPTVPAPIPAAPVRYGSFTHFCYSLFARASIHAFLAANAGKCYRDEGLRPPRIDEFHNALRTCLATTCLSRGQNLCTALKSDGRKLLWGTTNAPLGLALLEARAARSDLRVLLHDAHAPEGDDGPPLTIRLPLPVGDNAGGRRTGFKDLIPPPYWFFLIVDSRTVREGALDVFSATRAVVLPIAAEHGPFVVESGFERSVLRKLLAKNIAFLKPASHYALGELGANFWPFSLLPNGRLPHRPDLIVYAKKKCWLTELAGLDGDPEYLRRVERRLEAMLGVAAHSDVRTHRVDRGKFLREAGK